MFLCFIRIFLLALSQQWVFEEPTRVPAPVPTPARHVVPLKTDSANIAEVFSSYGITRTDARTALNNARGDRAAAGRALVNMALVQHETQPIKQPAVEPQTTPLHVPLQETKTETPVVTHTHPQQLSSVLHAIGREMESNVDVVDEAVQRAMAYRNGKWANSLNSETQSQKHAKGKKIMTKFICLVLNDRKYEGTGLAKISPPSPVAPPLQETKTQTQTPALLRQMSSNSRERLETLHDLERKVDLMNVQVNEFHEFHSSIQNGTINIAELSTIQNRLSQCYGNLEQLRNTEIDAISTMDLISGKDQAKLLRKKLTKRTGMLMNIVKLLVERIKKRKTVSAAAEEKAAPTKEEEIAAMLGVRVDQIVSHTYKGYTSEQLCTSFVRLFHCIIIMFCALTYFCCCFENVISPSIFSYFSFLFFCASQYRFLFCLVLIRSIMDIGKLVKKD